MNKDELRIKLKTIVDNDFKLHKTGDKSEYLSLMLEHIGDADMEIRDNYIYSILATWISEGEYFTSEEVIDLLNMLLSDDYAFYKIGSSNDNSVLKRSFSILQIDPILDLHINNNILSKDILYDIKDKLLKYLFDENDLRGYDKEIGLINSIGHVADCISRLLKCDEIDGDIAKEVLYFIGNKFCEGKEVFTAEEDERITTVICYDIIKNNMVDDEYICSWIEGLSRVLDIDDFITANRARINVKNLIRSIYFRLLADSTDNKLIFTLVDLEKKINRYLLD